MLSEMGCTSTRGETFSPPCWICVYGESELATHMAHRLEIPSTPTATAEGKRKKKKHIPKVSE